MVFLIKDKIDSKYFSWNENGCFKFELIELNIKKTQIIYN